METTERALAALFDDRADAITAYDQLRGEGFSHVWMATTKPAQTHEEHVDPDASPLETPVQNDVEESSDGVLGVIGRFFTGEGNSLRRSLEDHGIDPLLSVEIDDRLTPLGAVVTVYLGDRFELAEATMREAGGRIMSGTRAAPANLAVRAAFSAPVALSTEATPLAVREDVFFERRPRAAVTMSTPAAGARQEP